MGLRDFVHHAHATPAVRKHALYAFYNFGLKKSAVAALFGKVPSTIALWINQYESGEGLSRKERARAYRKLTPRRRKWILDLFKRQPTLFLDEAKVLFQSQFPGCSISLSSVSVILKEAGMTWKVLERRAIQISKYDVFRFAMELSRLPWLLENLVFLDEVSFDNRGMLQTQGYAKKGERLVYRGEFNRKPRVSFLTFINFHGVIETFITDGTFQ
ncbi:hypothetical protein BDR26DRAFT_432816 [Obelidium mucronatum]|nr:hypothetical protein BDR26DRAFT_432816 [Obelidium mucronatum]